MKGFVIKSNVAAPFQLFYRQRQTSVFVCNLPLTATSSFVRHVFENFGAVLDIRMQEHGARDRQHPTEGPKRPARIAVVTLSPEAAINLQRLKEDEFVIVATAELMATCKMPLYLQSLGADAPASDEWAELFMRLYDQMELPKEVDGWKLNRRPVMEESERKKRKDKVEFLSNFYRQEARQEDLASVRRQRQYEERLLQAQREAGLLDSV